MVAAGIGTDAVYKNGSLVANADTGDDSPQGLRLGARDSGAAQFANIEVAEWVLLKAPSGTDISDWETYLTAKYGL